MKYKWSEKGTLLQRLITVSMENIPLHWWCIRNTYFSIWIRVTGFECTGLIFCYYLSSVYRNLFCITPTKLCIEQASVPQALRWCRLFQAQKVLDGAKHQSWEPLWTLLPDAAEACRELLKQNRFAQKGEIGIMQAYHVQSYATVVDVVNVHNRFEILTIDYVSRYVYNSWTFIIKRYINLILELQKSEYSTIIIHFQFIPQLA
jgi:hypothetical protein